MNLNEEQFDDFKTPESMAYVSEAIGRVFEKELTEVEQFKEELDETIEMSDSPKDTLTEMITGYIQGMGDVDQVNVCSYDNGSGVALDGWSFTGDEDMTSIDLFLTVYVEPEKSKKISAKELDRHFNWLYRFYEQSISGSVLGKFIDDTKSDLYQVADLIHSTERIDRIRFFLMTNAIAPSDYEKETVELEGGTSCEYIIWDAKRVMRQDNIISGKDPIVVDFDADYNCPLPCIQMPDVSENVACYLCVIPGTILSQIYHKYHQQILEQNVRTFLQFKGASNKGIRDTMIGHKTTAAEKRKGVVDTEPEPDMFFAYNNGISTTAADIEFRQTDQGVSITRIKDWQIVNGGQTTASISTVLGMKGVDTVQLSKVFVPMKVSVIKNKEKQSIIVQKISRFANTQSAVKKSDFNINEPFLVDIEQLSRQEWAKNSSDKPVSKWFFERTRGQYLDKAKRQSTKTAEREFYAEYPKSQMFDKTLLSKFMMAWLQNPASVCRGGENNYGVFFTRMKQNGIRFDAAEFHRTIAKCILFKTIDAYYAKGALELPGYKSNMVAYTLASLSKLSEGRIDLAAIWNEQFVISPSVQNELTIDMSTVYAKLLCGHKHITYKIKESYKTDDGRTKNHYLAREIPEEDIKKIKATTLYKVMEFVAKIEKTIWEHITRVDEGTNINEWTKSTRCWDALKVKFDTLPALQMPEELKVGKGDDPDQLTDAQKQKMAAANEIGFDTWNSLHQWVKETEAFTPREISFIGQFAFIIKRNRTFTYKQAKWALDLYEKAQRAGWHE